jgi:hypothetical protein
MLIAEGKRYSEASSFIDTESNKKKLALVSISERCDQSSIAPYVLQHLFC